MAPVATAADHVGGQAAALERALVGPHIGRRPGEDDNLAGRSSRRHQLGHAAGEGTRLTKPPRRRHALELPLGALVDQEQLDPRLAGLACERVPATRAPRLWDAGGRPGTNGVNRSPIAVVKAAFNGSRISGRERKLVCRVRRRPAAPRRCPRAANRVTSAWRKR